MHTPSPENLLKAFADQTRLRILNLLSGGTLCVCDIMVVLKVPQPKISRHLAYLRRHKLVNTKRQGSWVYYSLGSPVGKLHRALLEGLKASVEETPIFAKDQKALRTIERRSTEDCK